MHAYITFLYQKILNSQFHVEVSSTKNFAFPIYQACRNTSSVYVSRLANERHFEMLISVEISSKKLQTQQKNKKRTGKGGDKLSSSIYSAELENAYSGLVCCNFKYNCFPYIKLAKSFRLTMLLHPLYSLTTALLKIQHFQVTLPHIFWFAFSRKKELHASL